MHWFNKFLTEKRALRLTDYYKLCVKIRKFTVENYQKKRKIVNSSKKHLILRAYDKQI